MLFSPSSLTQGLPPHFPDRETELGEGSDRPQPPQVQSWRAGAGPSAEPTRSLQPPVLGVRFSSQLTGNFPAGVSRVRYGSKPLAVPHLVPIPVSSPLASLASQGVCGLQGACYMGSSVGGGKTSPVTSRLGAKPARLA